MNTRQKSLLSISYIALTITLAAVPQTVDAGTCCVWRVTNSPAPCYLVGALHALSSHDYRLPAGYYQALRDSKRFVFEMNPSLEDDFDKKFCKAVAYPKGDDIRRHVHLKTWQILEGNFRRASMFGRGIRLGDTYLEYGMQQLRPWAITYFFYGIPGYSDVYNYYGVDSYFARQAKGSGKEVAGLETIDEHVEVLHGMNDAESELMLVETMVYRDKKREEYNQIRAAWRRGDVATMRSIRQHYRILNPSAEVRLLDSRNAKWIPKIRAEFNSGKPTSIVVGVGHMWGPNGLIALLQRSGYKFEQL